MKRLGLLLVAAAFMACQSSEKANEETSSDSIHKDGGITDSLSYTYDSVKVYSKHPLSKDPKVTDTAKATISYPVFSDEKINEFIKQKILKTAGPDNKYKTYQEYTADFIKGFDEFQTQNKDRIQTWFLNITTKVIKQQANYISLQITYVNFSGGAHPNSAFIYLNYNPATHQEIQLDSLLLPGSKPKLTAIAEGIFRKDEKLKPDASLKDGYFFENNTFKLNENFTITDRGLMFLYNPYEIKAYAYGTTKLTVPFSELKDITQPNSLLSVNN